MPTPVYMGNVPLSKTLTLLLFGYRLDLAKAKCGEAELPKGHFIEYVVLEQGGSFDGCLHVLAQSESVTYSASLEKDDYLIADSFDWREAPKLETAPNWKSEEACWPVTKNGPMMFCEQWSLPECDITRTHLTFDTTVFLFAQVSDKEHVFKITTQDIGLQTAEEHYSEE